MGTQWRIKIWDQYATKYADDVADNEEDARKQAAGWTGQRGQMKWTAYVYAPNGTRIATYKRGVDSTKKETK